MYPTKLLEQFAGMCQKSHAPDGDWQGDGWGIAIQAQNSKLKAQKWEVYTSLLPIWEESGVFQKFEQTGLFVVHARSAGFSQHKGVVAYNQPYVRGELAFVFNGMIRGVTLPVKASGTIGAQKVFSLITDCIQHKGPNGVLPYVRDLIQKHVRKVEGMNIGLAVGDRLHALCDYENNADYFSLRFYKDGDFTMICSAHIGTYRWQTMKKGEVLSF